MLKHLTHVRHRFEAFQGGRSSCRTVLQVILDLQEECGKYGMVESVKVPRPALPAQAPALFGTSNFGKVMLTAVPASGMHI